jgi:hypothetical protein
LLEQICDQVNKPDFDFDFVSESENQKNIQWESQKVNILNYLKTLKFWVYKM